MKRAHLILFVVSALVLGISVSASQVRTSAGSRAPASVQLSAFAPEELGLFARVLENGAVFQGDTVVFGRIISSPPDSIVFQTGGGTAFTIGFTLPAGGGLGLRKVVNGQGTLTVNSSTTPGSSRQTVIVVQGKQFLAGFTWQLTGSPGSLDLGPGVRLIQGSPGVGVPVYLDTPSGRTRILPGRVTTITAGTQTYTVFVHTSMYQLVPARFHGEDTPPGYILRALVLAN